METVDGLRKVLRRGNALVQKPYVFADKDGNDYGRIVPERPTPFRSSAIDVLQAAVRSNADAQYRKRAAPEGSEKAGERSGAPEHGRFFYGCYKLRDAA